MKQLLTGGSLNLSSFCFVNWLDFSNQNSGINSKRPLSVYCESRFTLPAACNKQRLMSKSFFLFLLPIFFCGTPVAFSQITPDEQLHLVNPGIQKWFPGWYISLQGDTVRGFIYLSNQIDNQMLLKYAVDNPPVSAIKTMTPADVRGYRVKDRVYESLLTESTRDAAPSFFRRMESGRINLYAWYSLPLSGTLPEGKKQRPITVNDEKFHEQVFYLKTGDELPFRVPGNDHFAEEMSRLLADDKELSGRVKQALKSYRAADILNIIQEYNKWYRDQH